MNVAQVQPDDPARRFGLLLRQVRTRAAMSQEALAVAIGANDLQRISEAENGTRRLKPAALMKLTETLDPATRTELVASWVAAQGELPIELHVSDADGRSRPPSPLAMSVAVSFAAWWPTLSRAESSAAKACLSVLRWALSRLGEPPG